MMPVHYWKSLAIGTGSSSTVTLIDSCIILFSYFAIPATAPTTDERSAAHLTTTTRATSDPSVAPIIRITIEPMLLLANAVTLYPDAIPVNTQEQSYIRYNVLLIINIKV